MLVAQHHLTQQPHVLLLLYYAYHSMTLCCRKFTLYLLMWFRISISLSHPVNMRNLAALIVPDNDALNFTKSMIELELLRRTRREIIVLTEPNLLLSSIRHLEFITSYVSLSSA